MLAIFSRVCAPIWAGRDLLDGKHGLQPRLAPDVASGDLVFMGGESCQDLGFSRFGTLKKLRVAEFSATSSNSVGEIGGPGGPPPGRGASCRAWWLAIGKWPLVAFSFVGMPDLKVWRRARLTTSQTSSPIFRNRCGFGCRTGCRRRAGLDLVAHRYFERSEMTIRPRGNCAPALTSRCRRPAGSARAESAILFAGIAELPEGHSLVLLLVDVA